MHVLHHWLFIACGLNLHRVQIGCLASKSFQYSLVIKEKSRAKVRPLMGTSGNARESEYYVRELHVEIYIGLLILSISAMRRSMPLPVVAVAWLAGVVPPAGGVEPL
jgi:hypothetical protein